MDDVGLPAERIELLADVLAVQLPQRGIRHVVKQLGSENALVAREVHRLQEGRTVHIVGRTPRTVHPVSTSLEDVMLEIVLILQQHAQWLSLLSKSAQSMEVPTVRAGQVVARETVPSCTLSRAGKGLFVEGSPDVAVLAAQTLVVITAAVVPQSVVLAEHQCVVTLHTCHHRVDTIGIASTFLTRHEARQAVLGLRDKRIAEPARPPGCLVFATDQ